MKVLSLSEYVIRHASELNKNITNLKLQKTLYYLQGYCFKKFNEAAFEEEIQNWQYGPVAPAAYFAYSSYGSDSLVVNQNSIIESVPMPKKQVFNVVIEKCLEIPARKLVQMTHEEDPWRETNQNQEITSESIKNFFQTNDPLKIVGKI